MKYYLSIIILLSLLISSTAGNLFKYDQITSLDIVTSIQLIEESKEGQETKMLLKEYLTINFLTPSFIITRSFYALGIYMEGSRTLVEIPPELHYLPV